ncbi:hypothetical protein [Actinoplanes sp. GCM10030250]|uniref:hypothetical protein n=1 Tax=Actinoplanes sp. GCM10030250 TaxID=3273376 RepID=UPI0036217118
MNRWPIARYLLTTHYIFLIIIMVGFYAACAVLLTVVALFTEIRISTVDVAGQVVCWLALGYGASSTTLLSTMLVHGRTRREFLREYPVFLLITSVTLAALTAGAYAAEAAVYSAFDWGQKMQDNRIFESASDFPTVYVAYLSMLLIWLTTGAFLGAAFYRWQAGGVLAVPFAAVLVLTGGGFNGFFSLVPGLRTDTPDLAAILLVSLGLAAAAWAMLWYTARDLPLRVRAA